MGIKKYEKSEEHLKANVAEAISYREVVITERRFYFGSPRQTVLNIGLYLHGYICTFVTMHVRRN